MIDIGAAHIFTPANDDDDDEVDDEVDDDGSKISSVGRSQSQPAVHSRTASNKAVVSCQNDEDTGAVSFTLTSLTLMINCKRDCDRIV